MSKAAYVLVGVVFLSTATVGIMCSKAADQSPSSKPTTQPTTKSAFVNLRCPIMGTPIVPGNVTPDLTREYKGQKVAFCCSMCPPAWDKLTDAEKDAKLKAASEPKPAK